MDIYYIVFRILRPIFRVIENDHRMYIDDHQRLPHQLNLMTEVLIGWYPNAKRPSAFVGKIRMLEGGGWGIVPFCIGQDMMVHLSIRPLKNIKLTSKQCADLNSGTIYKMGDVKDEDKNEDRNEDKGEYKDKDKSEDIFYVKSVDISKY